ncbi:MAG: aspartyl/asparaginyl beta-hydroxylase domain-containing protein [Gammaproteobacteria bacterium]|nr:aspartyl/asparaginyl beta-hydroxylase domain-containing protein [Gammaproteobacteria bacterium]
MKLTRPFIQLPLRFDAARLAEEAAGLPDDAWLPHPSGQRGNLAVPLISRDGGANDDFTGPMAATPHLLACQYHQQAMAAFGEVLARSRLMKLQAGHEVGLHVDFNYHWHTRVRVHIPIVTRPEVYFYCGDEQLHMAAGECWLFDNWRRHNVVNASTEDRIHLVIDLAGSSRFWNMVEAMQALDPVADRDRLHGMLRDVTYEPERPVQIDTEQFNIAPVMAPGEVDALVAELIRDFSGHSGNDPGLVRAYQKLLRDFARDWRQTWLRHGSGRRGIPHYQELIERTSAALHPDRRALVTASNDIGVNPVIMQRILRPALAVDRFDA